MRVLGIDSMDESPFGVGNAPGRRPARDPPEPTSMPPTIVNGGISFIRIRRRATSCSELALGKTIRLQYDDLVDGKAA